MASPIELLKTQMQVKNLDMSAFQLMKNIVRSHGLQSLNRGLALTILRDVPGAGIYFVTYEALIRQCETPTTFAVLMAGGIGGILSWIFTYPTDVIKSRIQADRIPNGVYSGNIDCLRKTVQAEGVQSLGRGIGSAIIRAFPVNAVTMTVATTILKVLAGEEDLSAYESISRLRGFDSFRPYANSNAFYHNKCQYVLGNGQHLLVRSQMDNFDISTSMGRIFMETQLIACPEKSQVSSGQ